MSKSIRMTKAQRKIDALPKGWVDIEMFRVGIPIFVTPEDLYAYMDHYKMDYLKVPSDKVFEAFAGYAFAKDNTRLLFAVVPITTPVSTWVHEASHLVDYIFDYLGIDTGIEATETRAYMLAHIFSSIEEILLPLQLPSVITEAPANRIPV